MNDSELKEKRRFTLYLSFIMAACIGASVWQILMPFLAEMFSSWGSALGWQREISLWNVSIIVAILFSLLKQNILCMKIMTLQATVLCWLLGINHFVALIQNFSLTYIIHWLGIFEVMLIGGIWGTVLLLYAKKIN